MAKGKSKEMLHIMNPGTAGIGALQTAGSRMKRDFKRDQTRNKKALRLNQRSILG